MWEMYTLGRRTMKEVASHTHLLTAKVVHTVQLAKGSVDLRP